MVVNGVNVKANKTELFSSCIAEQTSTIVFGNVESGNCITLFGFY